MHQYEEGRTGEVGYALDPVSGPSPAAIVTSDLVRRFGSFPAVDGIDLRVAQGEIYGFLGPNGAGKSTLLRMLCTLLRPSSGRALVAGYDVVDEPQEVRFRIGVALQEAALDDRQSGRELLALQGRLYGLTGSEIRTRLGQVLDLVDIGPAIDRRIGTYSGGMKRRLDLAAALVHNPEVLFLDEPTTGLDPTSRESVWSEVRRLNTDLGMTIFLTTQYLEEADELADRVGIISRGRLVAEGPPDELKRAVGGDVIVVEADGADPGAAEAVGLIDVVESVSVEEGTFTIGTSDGSSAVNAVVMAFSGTGLRVRSVTVRTPTLDDVFRQLTGSPIDAGSAGDAGSPIELAEVGR
jgi:ABC-2 type transport system ATP-binding protein